MARMIQPVPQEPEERKTRKQELSTSDYVMIYPRVSTPEQMKNVSTEMQQDKTFALVYGWTDELIIVDTSDLGLSGRLRMEDRPAFVRMLRLVANGTVKTVIVAQVDRLFRDRWGQEYSKFMEICFTYGVRVVTLTHDRKAIDFIYDFSISWHVDQFRRECEAAWRYIEKQIHRMNAARNELAKMGCWSGGNLVAGYIPDDREYVNGKINPNYLKYIRYNSHANKIAALYERFRELGGGLTRLFDEIRRVPYIFGPFDNSVDQRFANKLLLKKVFNEDSQMLGYTIAIPKSLASILTNPVYIGYWLHHNQVISTNNHESIVDFDLFMYAFTRLSPTNLDGSPNQSYLDRLGHYSKKYHAERPAYLKNHAFCTDETLRIYEKGVPCGAEERKGEVRTLYGFIPYKDYVKHVPVYSIPVEDVDNRFFTYLKKRLYETDTLNNYLDHENTDLKIQSQLLEDVKRDVKAIESLMRKAEKQIASGAITDPDLLKLTNDTYTGHKQEFARLQQKQRDIQANNGKAQQRRTYKQLIAEIKDEWTETYPPEELIPSDELPLLVDTFALKVVFEILSNHFYKMLIYWRDPEWGIDELVCYRPTRSSPNWTEEEDNIVRQYYPTAKKSDLMKMLPQRSISSIQGRAASIGLSRAQRGKNEDSGAMIILHKHFSLEDCQIVEKYHFSVEHVAKMKEATIIQHRHIMPQTENLDTCSGSWKEVTGG